MVTNGMKEDSHSLSAVMLSSSHGIKWQSCNEDYSEAAKKAYWSLR